jgi:hypothetical protein
LNNLKNNEQEMKTFKERITTLCKSKDITIDLEKDDAINQIIDGTLPIDNTDKKVRLNVDWVFYLLGECCNESLGMKIKGLDIITTTIVPVVPVIPDLPPVVTYESSTHIAGRNLPKLQISQKTFFGNFKNFSISENTRIFAGQKTTTYAKFSKQIAN